MAKADPPILSSEDVIVEFEHDSPTLAVAFGSMLGRVGGVPHFEFMNMLSRLGVKRAFVRDTKACWYQGGVAGMESSVDDLAAGVGELVQISGAERVVFIGSSSGGYAAILFACLVAVDEALVFAPQTFIDPEQRAAAGDTRWPRPTQWVLQCLDRRYADLRAVMNARIRADPRPHVALHYAANDELDTLHAQHLVDLPSVELIPHDDARHGLPSHLKQLGRLEPIIAGALSVTSPGKRA